MQKIFFFLFYSLSALPLDAVVCSCPDGADIQQSAKSRCKAHPLGKVAPSEPRYELQNLLGRDF